MKKLTKALSLILSLAMTISMLTGVSVFASEQLEVLGWNADSDFITVDFSHAINYEAATVALTADGATVAATIAPAAEILDNGTAIEKHTYKITPAGNMQLDTLYDLKLTGVTADGVANTVAFSKVFEVKEYTGLKDGETQPYKYSTTGTTVPWFFRTGGSSNTTATSYDDTSITAGFGASSTTSNVTRSATFYRFLPSSSNVGASGAYRPAKAPRHAADGSNPQPFTYNFGEKNVTIKVKATLDTTNSEDYLASDNIRRTRFKIGIAMNCQISSTEGTAGEDAPTYWVDEDEITRFTLNWYENRTASNPTAWGQGVEIGNDIDTDKEVYANNVDREDVYVDDDMFYTKGVSSSFVLKFAKEDKNYNAYVDGKKVADYTSVNAPTSGTPMLIASAERAKGTAVKFEEFLMTYFEEYTAVVANGEAALDGTTVTAPVLASEDVEVIALCAVYEGEEMVAVYKSETTEIAEGAANVVFTDVAVAAGQTYKVFVWDAATLAPYTEF